MRILALVILVLLSCEVCAQTEFDYNLCRYYSRVAKDDSLAHYLETSRPKMRSATDKAFHAYFRGMLARYMGQRKLIITELDEAARLCEKHELPDSLKGFIDLEYSILYRYKFQDKALDHIHRSITYFENDSRNDLLSKAYLVKGNIYYGKDSSYREPDSAYYYYRKAKELNSDSSNLMLILSNLATLASDGEINDFVETENILLEVIDYQAKNEMSKQKNKSTFSLISLYNDNSKFDKAELFLAVASEEIELNGWEEHKPFELRAYKKLYANKGDFKKAMEYQDSLQKWEEKNAEFELENLLTQHTLESELATAKATTYKNRLWISVLGGTTGTLLLFLFGYNRYNKLKQSAIKQELETTKMQAALDAAKAKIDGEQKERRAIASVLHDKVASLLTAADVHLKVAGRKEGGESLEKASEILKDVNMQVRDLSHQLVSPTLTRFGLEAALDSLVSKTDSKDLKITLDSTIGNTRYSENKETFLYRATTELLQNVMKHSNGNYCEIKIQNIADKMELRISDNGALNEEINMGHGLTHISNKVEAFRGKFEIINNPHNLTFVIELPISPIS